MILNGKQEPIMVNGKDYHCSLDITMDYIGGKWKAIILWYLRDGKKRFGELNRLIPEITERMLSLQLKDLEKDGLVTRKIFPEVPPRVEYELTGLGNSLQPVVREMAKWGTMMAKGVSNCK